MDDHLPSWQNSKNRREQSDYGPFLSHVMVET